jgi:hypothetical protein
VGGKKLGGAKDTALRAVLSRESYDSVTRPHVEALPACSDSDLVPDWFKSTDPRLREWLINNNFGHHEQVPFVPVHDLSEQS